MEQQEIKIKKNYLPFIILINQFFTLFIFFILLILLTVNSFADNGLLDKINDQLEGKSNDAACVLIRDNKGNYQQTQGESVADWCKNNDSKSNGNLLGDSVDPSFLTSCNNDRCVDPNKLISGITNVILGFGYFFTFLLMFAENIPFESLVGFIRFLKNQLQGQSGTFSPDQELSHSSVPEHNNFLKSVTKFFANLFNGLSNSFKYFGESMNPSKTSQERPPQSSQHGGGEDSNEDSNQNQTGGGFMDWIKDQLSNFLQFIVSLVTNLGNDCGYYKGNVIRYTLSIVQIIFFFCFSLLINGSPLRVSSVLFTILLLFMSFIFIFTRTPYNNPINIMIYLVIALILIVASILLFVLSKCDIPFSITQMLFYSCIIFAIMFIIYSTNNNESKSNISASILLFKNLQNQLLQSESNLNEINSKFEKLSDPAKKTQFVDENQADITKILQGYNKTIHKFENFYIQHIFKKYLEKIDEKYKDSKNNYKKEKLSVLEASLRRELQNVNIQSHDINQTLNSVKEKNKNLRELIVKISEFMGDSLFCKIFKFYTIFSKSFAYTVIRIFLVFLTFLFTPVTNNIPLLKAIQNSLSNFWPWGIFFGLVIFYCTSFIILPFTNFILSIKQTSEEDFDKILYSSFYGKASEIGVLGIPCWFNNDLEDSDS